VSGGHLSAKPTRERLLFHHSKAADKSVVTGCSFHRRSLTGIAFTCFLRRQTMTSRPERRHAGGSRLKQSRHTGSLLLQIWLPASYQNVRLLTIQIQHSHHRVSVPLSLVLHVVVEYDLHHLYRLCHFDDGWRQSSQFLIGVVVVEPVRCCT
jgi:hypothetical protein